jgi:4-oxalocrotonate tautomerase
LFRFSEVGFRRFHATLNVFASHHGFKLAIFRLGHLRLGVGDFVLQGFVRFVRFYRATLIAVFAGAFFPLFDVQLEFFAFFEAVGVSFLGGCHRGSGAGKSSISIAKASGKSFELSANSSEALVGGLKVQQTRDYGMHTSILTHRMGWPDSKRNGGHDFCRLSRWRINMPHVQITWVEGRTPEQKRKIAERITNVLIEDGRAKRENIHVAFHDVPATNYAEAGTLVVDQKRSP